MFGFNNSTPTYKGNGQPATSGGGFLSGFLGYLFGGTVTPAYKGTAEKSATTSRLSLFGNRTPSYQAAPSVVTQTPAPTSAQTHAPDDGDTPDGLPPDGTSNGSSEPPIYVCIR
jgi:hypothetical protein